ncbi:MAG: zf-HC2 domain-containing protein [Candidatus Acidiferrales bacterium]|jgi:anti-sigma factor RsiW
MSERNQLDACSEFEPLLEDLLDGDQDAAEAQRLQAHLAGCAGCSNALRAARQASQLLREFIEPAAQPSIGFALRTMNAIRAEEESAVVETSFWRPMQTFGWRLAMSAGLALALLIGYAQVVPKVPEANGEEIARSAVPTEIFQDPMYPPQSREDVLLMVSGAGNDNK